MNKSTNKERKHTHTNYFCWCCVLLVHTAAQIHWLHCKLPIRHANPSENSPPTDSRTVWVWRGNQWYVGL